MPPKLRHRAVERQTLSEQIYQSLKRAIIERDLAPGERLKEFEIAESLGASRTPVREALSKLEQQGFVRPHRSGGLTVVELSKEDVVEVFGLMKVLETYAAQLAAERISPRRLEQLEKLCDRAERVVEGDGEVLGELNRRFHELLVETAGHRRLQDLIANLRYTIQPYRIVSLTQLEFRRSSITDHRAIVEALRARDGQRLANLIVAHFDVAQRVTLEGLRQEIAAASGQT